MKMSRRSRQHVGYVLGSAFGIFVLALLFWPGSEDFRAPGPMNVGHGDLKCSRCHVPAPGTARQQLQGKTRHLLGLRRTTTDFGLQDVVSERCIACHERRNERHPIYRFYEPRFEKARRAIGPQSCLSCHLEHTGRRVTVDTIGFCIHCHKKTHLRKDPLATPHHELIKQEKWTSCLGCHDFHGNHIMDVENDLEKAFSPVTLRNYFAGGPTPYPKRKYDDAKREPVDER